MPSVERHEIQGGVRRYSTGATDVGVAAGGRSAGAAIFTNEDCIGYPYPVFEESGLSPLPFIPKSAYVF